MKVLICHLSDIHIARCDDEILRRSSHIATALFPLLGDVETVFVAVSGDIANTGQAEEYDLATAFFDGIKASILSQSTASVHFIFAPGNHDCNFSTTDGVRRAVVDQIIQRIPELPDNSMIEICTAVQDNFRTFCCAFQGSSFVHDSDRLFFQQRFELGRHSLVFDIYNASWLSQRRESAGKLWLPHERYSSAFRHDDAMHVALLHHPVNWYAPGEHRGFWEFLRQKASLVLTGHEHEQTGAATIDATDIRRDTVFVEGGALWDRSATAQSAFNIIVVDLDAKTQTVHKVEWTERSGASGYWPNGVDEDEARELPLPEKIKDEFTITKGFLERIRDAGASFQHPRKRDRLTIDDVFVYPDVHVLDKADDDSERVSARTLELLPSTPGHVWITGEERAGKTTLALILFRSFVQQGLFPVYLDAIDIKNAGGHELKKIVCRALRAQFGEAAVEAFFKKPLCKRVVLVDNFELIPIGERYRHKVFEFINKEFGHSFILSGELSHLEELLSPQNADILARYRVCRLLKFGHKLRYELINRWNSLGDDYDVLGEGDLIARNDSAQKEINRVIGRSVVPSVPLYLLTILQSMELGQISDIQRSGFGHYYHFLIVLALRGVQIKDEEQAEIFSYLGGLSMRMFEAQRTELSELELLQFNQWFSQEITTVDFHQRKTVLLGSGILVRHGSSFSFKYPYLYYYFVSKALANKLSDGTARQVVVDLCRHLHVAENANIIVFLTHHTSDPIITSELLGLLRSLFKRFAPIEFGADVARVNALVQEAPLLTYARVDPHEHRTQMLERKDEAEARDPLDDSEENPSIEGLDVLAQMALVFRVLEIVGQVLRNSYGSMKKTSKTELLHESFSAPLRTLSALLSDVVEDPAALAEMVAMWMKQDRPNASDDQRRVLSQKLMFSLVAAIANFVLEKTSDAIGFEKLREEYALVLGKAPAIGSRLIDIAIKLDMPRQIPYAELNQLAKDLNRNTLALYVLRSSVLRHLHMFRTGDMEKQRLCHGVGIKMEVQRAIDHKTRRTKLLSKMSG